MQSQIISAVLCRKQRIMPYGLPASLFARLAYLKIARYRRVILGDDIRQFKRDDLAVCERSRLAQSPDLRHAAPDSVKVEISVDRVDARSRSDGSSFGVGFCIPRHEGCPFIRPVEHEVFNNICEARNGMSFLDDILIAGIAVICHFEALY